MKTVKKKTRNTRTTKVSKQSTIIAGANTEVPKKKRKTNKLPLKKKDSRLDTYKAMYVLSELCELSRSQAYKILHPNTIATGGSLNVLASRMCNTEEYDTSAYLVKEYIQKKFDFKDVDITTLEELSKEDAIKMLTASLSKEPDPKKNAEILMLLSKLKGWDKMQEETKETHKPIMYIPYNRFKESLSMCIDKLDVNVNKEDFINTFKTLFNSYVE